MTDKPWFKVKKFSCHYTGGSVESARALFEIANQLRLQNYLKALEIYSSGDSNIINADITMVIDQLEESDNTSSRTSSEDQK